jgi:hypothetical protein
MGLIRCLVVLALLLGGCSSHSRGNAPVTAELAPIPQGLGRIFAYHDLKGIQRGHLPSVPLRIGTAAAGSLTPDAAAFWDLPPGRYDVTIDPSVAARWDLEIVRGPEIRLAAGEQVFVTIMLAFHPIARQPPCAGPSCVCVEIETDPDRQDFIRDRVRRPVYNPGE